MSCIAIDFPLPIQRDASETLSGVVCSRNDTTRCDELR
jgi:hypothetical protein